MSAPARAGQGGVAPVLPAGTLVADRFEIQALVRNEAGTELYRARDAQSGEPALVRLVPSRVRGRAALEADLAVLTGLDHRNLAAVLAVGAHGAHLFVASEANDGHSLRELVDSQRAQSQTVGPSHARTLLGHVANALEAAHGRLAHGGLNPETVWVSRAGRVKVADLGLTRGLPELARRGSPAGAPQALYVAPEVARGGAPSPAADVYSLGGLLYELICGIPPALPLRAPSQTVPGVPGAVDAVIAKALSPHPQARHATPAELMRALESALAEPVPGAAGPGAAGGRQTLGKSFDVAQAAGISDQDERWLVQKDRLDYGPFSLQQVMAQIERGAFGGDHWVVDTETGERQKIKEHPLLADFTLEAERKLEVARRAQAEQVHEVVEKKKSTFMFLVIGAAVAAVGAGGYFYLKNRKAAEADVLASRVNEEDVDAFIKQVKLDVSQKKRGGTRRGGGGRDDDFNAVTNLGDVSQGAADEVLSDGVVQRVMMGNYRKLVPCIMEERRRNPGLSDVEIEFVVLGSGKVSAVRVNGQPRGGFPACVLGRMQSFGFPSFNGRKTIASWSMSMR